jgi:hypothetical protein
MPPAASDKKVLRLNMALPLDYFAIDFQSNRDIPRCRRLLPYYRRRSLCQAVKTAVHEVARAGVDGVMWQLPTPSRQEIEDFQIGFENAKEALTDGYGYNDPNTVEIDGIVFSEDLCAWIVAHGQ